MERANTCILKLILELICHVHIHRGVKAIHKRKFPQRKLGLPAFMFSITSFSGHFAFHWSVVFALEN